MIQSGSYLRVVDNSGAVFIRCIQASKKNKCRYAYMGDMIIASVRRLRRRFKKRAKVKIGDVVSALILRTKSSLSHTSGNKTYYKSNYAIIFNKQNKPIGTRIFYGMPRHILKKFKNFATLKIVTMSTGITES